MRFGLHQLKLCFFQAALATIPFSFYIIYMNLGVVFKVLILHSLDFQLKVILQTWKISSDPFLGMTTMTPPCFYYLNLTYDEYKKVFRLLV